MGPLEMPLFCHDVYAGYKSWWPWEDVPPLPCHVCSCVAVPNKTSKCMYFKILLSSFFL